MYNVLLNDWHDKACITSYYLYHIPTGEYKHFLCDIGGTLQSMASSNKPSNVGNFEKQLLFTDFFSVVGELVETMSE